MHPGTHTHTHPLAHPERTWREQVLDVMSLSTSCYKMTTGSVDPVIGTYTLFVHRIRAHTQAHTHTAAASLTAHFCRYHLSFREWINRLSRREEYGGGKHTSACECVGGEVIVHTCVCIYFFTLHLARLDRCLPVWDEFARYGNVWINVALPRLALCITHSLSSRGHDPTANYRSCNSIHLLLSLTSTIEPSVIHLQVPAFVSPPRHSRRNQHRTWRRFNW